MVAHTAQQKEGNVTAFWANISDFPFVRRKVNIESMTPMFLIIDEWGANMEVFTPQLTIRVKLNTPS
jgi:hypothetical protein